MLITQPKRVLDDAGVKTQTGRGNVDVAGRENVNCGLRGLKQTLSFCTFATFGHLRLSSTLSLTFSQSPNKPWREIPARLTRSLLRLQSERISVGEMAHRGSTHTGSKPGQVEED